MTEILIWPNLFFLTALALSLLWSLNMFVLLSLLNEICPSPLHVFSRHYMFQAAILSTACAVCGNLLLFGWMPKRYSVDTATIVPGYDDYKASMALVSIGISFAPFMMTTIFYLVTYSNRCKRRCIEALIVSDDARLCRRILACEDISEHKLYSLPSRLHCRNLPNARLAHSLGIDNAFTTLDDAWRKDFRKMAEANIRAPSVKFWSNIGDLARETCHDRLGHLKGRQSHDLVPLIQDLTLRVTLSTFFHIDARQITSTTLRLIAEQINTLSSASQSCNVEGQPKWEDQHTLRSFLELATGTNIRLTQPRDNPLNILIPAYDTLWRVTTRCVIEVIYRNHPQMGEWRRLLADYVQMPNTINWDKQGKESTSVKFIAKEALRLYPPTRRVHRAYRGEVDGVAVEKNVAADVETLMRSDPVWGADAETFDPARWENVDRKTENDSFLAFGAGPYQCPARSEFAPKVLALLVAAVSTVVKEEWTLKARRTEDEVEPGRPLETDRNSYGSLYLVKKELGSALTK